MKTVALLGLGTVGFGVYRYLTVRGSRFAVRGVAVRGIDPVEVAAGGTDIVVELLGGLEPAASAIRAALLNGSHVVTANKVVVAECGPAFESLAASRGVKFLYAAAVGGGVPVLRTVRRLAGTITRVDGVLNGTTNFVLDRLAEGVSWEDAIARAQRAGFAEADPSLDLDGTDAAQKITIVARAAFGRAPDHIEQEGITPRTRGRLVASTWRAGSRVLARVAPRQLPPDHPLAKARDEENVVVIRHGGAQTVLWGKGAGREPTARAVVGDIVSLPLTRGSMTDLQLHDAILQGGRMPVELVRARLLGQRLPRDCTTQWRFADSR